MSVVQDGIRIGLIGPSYAGKTSLFRTLHEALDHGRHGFLKGTRPEIRRTADATPVDLPPEDILGRIGLGEGSEAEDAEIDEALRGATPATEPNQVFTRHFSLTYTDLRLKERRTIPLTITDAAGEHSFGKNLQSDLLKQGRDQLNRELAGCHGFVVVVPFSNAHDPNFVRRLESWLEALDKIAADREKAGAAPMRRRVVIALTRYDALLTDFGSEALKLAADPAIATDIINRLVASGGAYRNNIAKFDESAKGRFEIAFVPTSSFGFVPGFGCVNLDPGVPKDDAESAIKTGASPASFKNLAIPTYSNQDLFPFLTADPFIFAATGLENPFVISLDHALRQVPYDGERILRRLNGKPIDLNVAQSNDKAANGQSTTTVEEPDSWRRRFTRWLRRWEIEL